MVFRQCYRSMILPALLLCFCACGHVQDVQEQVRPNIVFILADQFRADLMGAYGGNPNLRTPHLDQLASEGVLFSNAIASSPLCTPDRGMVQTGRYPTHTGIVTNWIQVNPDLPTVAKLFADAGYETGFIGKWHLAVGAYKTVGKHAWTRGTPAEEIQKRSRQIREKIREYTRDNPDPEFVPPGPQRLGFDYWRAYNFHTSFRKYYFYADTPERREEPGFESDIIFDQALAFIQDQKASGKPFFLMLMPHPPHPPFDPDVVPEGYLDQIPETLAWSPNVPEDQRFRTNPISARCYYAMARNTDDNMGRLIDFLDAEGLSEKTIVVMTSDHGEMLGSHDRTSKLVPYAESINIPVVMRWVGHIPPGSRIDTVHTPMDHLPTLASLAGLQVPFQVDGLDFSAAILEGQSIERGGALIANYTSHFSFFDSQTIWPEWRGVRDRRYTYVRWLDGTRELYDNREDPYQLTNLIGDPGHEQRANALEARLQELLAEADDAFLPGTAYADWYDDERNLVRTALGPVHQEGEH